MPGTWKIKREPFGDAMVKARIGSAKMLAEAANIAPATAEKVVRGDRVSYQTVIAVVQALRPQQADGSLGEEPAMSGVFEVGS